MNDCAYEHRSMYFTSSKTNCTPYKAVGFRLSRRRNNDRGGGYTHSQGLIGTLDNTNTANVDVLLSSPSFVPLPPY